MKIKKNTFSLKKLFENKLALANIIVVIILLSLPYIVFNGRAFIGGDDSRLYYLYPKLYYENIASSAWFNFSLLGSYNPNYFIIPLLFVIIFLQKIFISATFVSYLFFSLPMIMGYFYFQKLSKEFFSTHQKDHSVEFAIGAAVYVFSPIFLAVLIGHFLYAVWLIALIPAIFYYYLKYLRIGRFSDVGKVAFLSAMLSLAMYSIPWILGFLLPAFAALLFMIIVRHIRPTFAHIRRTVIFVVTLLVTQSFWLLPFLTSLLPSKGRSYATNALSEETASTFATTVLATSRGTIFYPMLNLFHRQIAIDFNWPIAEVYRKYYDKVFYLAFIYIVILSVGFLFNRRVLNKKEHSNFLYIFVALLVSLFLFTVNIGPLKDLYLAFGKVPGFAMFRNGYDKFAPGFVVLFSLTITMCLVIASRASELSTLFKKTHKILLSCLVLVIIVNFLPVKNIIDRKLWKTQNIGTSIRVPDEYTEFMEDVGKRVPPTENALSLPFGSALYTVIKDKDRDSIFTGRSPVQIFSGIRDFSGTMSFSTAAGKEIESYIQSRNYDKLHDFLDMYNIHYIIETRNVPDQVLKSYLYSAPILSKQDDEFRENFYGDVFHTSTNKNYVLYELKDSRNDVDQFSVTSDYLQHEDKIVSDKDIQSLRSLISPTLPVIGQDEMIPKSRQVRRLPNNGELSIAPGEYQIFVSENNLAKLEIEGSNLVLNNSANFELNDNRIENGSKKVIRDFGDNNILSDGTVFIDKGTLINDGYTAEPNQEIAVYNTDQENLAGKLEDIPKEWSSGDCNQYDDFGVQKVYISEVDGSKELLLEANEEHNTCLWKKIKFKKGEVYKVNLDFTSNADVLSIAITNEKAMVTFSDNLLRKNQQNKPISTVSYYVPREDEEGLFIIYSGQSKNGSKTSYKRVEMMEYSKVDTLDLYNNFNSLDRNPIILKTESDATVASKPKLKNLDYTVDDFEKWSQSDCNAYTKDETATAYTFENDESITLKSKNEHNACIFQKVIINSNDIYTVDLDYEPYKKGENFLYVDFGKDFGYQKFLLDKKGHLNQDIIPPTGATNMLFVLYSGQTRSGEISMNYKAIKLQSYPKFHNLNSLVDHKDIKSSPTIEETKKIANHNYKLRVKTDGNNPFVLVMNDSYHAGWELLNTEKKGILAEHFMTNGYSNGWYLEPSNVCKDNTGCQLDSDGNYIIDLEADFALQRRFKTGAIVTVLSLGVVFILSVSSIFFHWYRKKKSSDYRVSDIN